MVKQLSFNTDPETRAIAAYYRRPAPPLGERMQHGDVQTHEINGHTYIRLSNFRGTLAVYRVLNNGALKGLVRWPAEIDEV